MGHVHIKTTVSIKRTIIVIIWALCARKKSKVGIIQSQ